MTKKEKRKMMLGEKIRKSLEERPFSMPMIGLYDESGKRLNQVAEMSEYNVNASLVSDINVKYEDS